MTTLHVENTVHDFDEWKGVFDKFDRVRSESGMRSYRLQQYVDQPNKVIVDMEFATLEDAESFRLKLEQIRTTPQSKAQLVEAAAPMLLTTVEQRAF
jgi:hypothetical protein